MLKNYSTKRQLSKIPNTAEKKSSVLEFTLSPIRKQISGKIDKKTKHSGRQLNVVVNKRRSLC